MGNPILNIIVCGVDYMSIQFYSVVSQRPDIVLLTLCGTEAESIWFSRALISIPMRKCAHAVQTVFHSFSSLYFLFWRAHKTFTAHVYSSTTTFEHFAFIKMKFVCTVVHMSVLATISSHKQDAQAHTVFTISTYGIRSAFAFALVDNFILYL